MSVIKISELQSGTPLDNDIIPYVDLTNGETKKALKSELKGDAGNSATVDAGTTTTLPAGSSATVVNSGTTSDAVFDFGIPKGDKGDQGIQGIQGIQGLDITWKGAYNSGTAYVINDAVSYLDSSYICVTNTTGNDPTTAYWNLMAKKGEDGAGNGDMTKAIYDTNNNGKVDTSDEVILHEANTSNPHSVDKADVGLGNVPNLSFSGTNTGDETVATGAEIDTGTDNEKMVTPKAIKDSKLSYTDGTETLTNKTIDYNNNTITNLPSGGSSFWTEITSPTRTANTTFTITDTGNADSLDKLYSRGTCLKWTESSVLKQAMIVSATYSADTVTITIMGDTMASIDADSLKYFSEKARHYKFAIAGTIGATGTDIANKMMCEMAGKIYGADIWAGTAGDGTTTVDINKGGTTMFTTKPSITTTDQNALSKTADNGTITAVGDYLTIDVDAVAATTKVVDLYVNVYYIPLYNSYLS